MSSFPARHVVPALRGKGPRTYRRAALFLRGGISTPLPTRALSSRGDGSLLEQARTRDDAQVSWGADRKRHTCSPLYRRGRRHFPGGLQNSVWLQPWAQECMEQASWYVFLGLVGATFLTYLTFRSQNNIATNKRLTTWYGDYQRVARALC